MKSVTKVLTAIVGLACLFLAAQHFTHEYQPRGRGHLLPGYDHLTGPTLAEIPKTDFARQAAESDLPYIGRMTRMVHSATYHCAPTEHSLSLIESGVEWALTHLGYGPQLENGLFNRDRIKCGFCSERALVLSDILERNGINSYAESLNGHVASLVLIDGRRYLADPDYGVGPYPYPSKEATIRAIYQQSSRPDLTDLVTPIIVNTADDYVYFTPEFLRGLKKLRAAFFDGSSLVAASFGFVGFVLTGLALRRYSRKHSKTRQHKPRR